MAWAPFSIEAAEATGILDVPKAIGGGEAQSGQQPEQD